MNGSAAREAIVRGVMDRWKSAVDAHEPEQAASVFTEDAVFQGLAPYGVGRQAIARYYASQPIGLVANYRVLETRKWADDVLLGYLSVDFTFTDRPAVQVTLGVVLRRVGDQWYVTHYQVSKLG